jgi:hypothetical protein
MNKNLQMSLETKWFQMTNQEIEPKTEDYRELNAYWCSRLIDFDSGLARSKFERAIFQVNIARGLSVPEAMKEQKLSFKQFKTNTMTLGYPNMKDSSRISKFEHAGIEIRTGNPVWGAQEGKLYFVIKHGKKYQ